MAPKAATPPRPPLPDLCGLNSESLSHDRAAASNGLQIGHAATAWGGNTSRGGEGSESGWRSVFQEGTHGLRLTKDGIHDGGMEGGGVRVFGLVKLKMCCDNGLLGGSGSLVKMRRKSWEKPKVNWKFFSCSRTRWDVTRDQPERVDFFQLYIRIVCVFSTPGGTNPTRALNVATPRRSIRY